METIEYINQNGERKTLTLLEIIGKGAYGTVYKSLLDGYGLVAVKKQLLKEIENIITECKISGLELKYSVTIKKVLFPDNVKEKYEDTIISELGFDIYKNKISYINSEHCYLIYDLIDGIELKAELDTLETINKKLQYDIVIRYIKSLITGLNELSQHNIVHRDIKPANIMLQRGELKYIDFGLTCFSDKCKGFAGSPEYIAPEGFKKDSVNDWVKMDIFAVGVIILYIVTYKTILNLLEIENVYQAITFFKKDLESTQNKTEISIKELKFEDPNDKIKNLIIMMTKIDAKNRANIQQCIEYIDNFF